MRHPLVFASSASSPAVPMFRDVPQTTPLPTSIPPTPTVCQPRHRLAHLIPRDTTPLPKFPFEFILHTRPISLSLRSFPVPRACHCSPHARHHTRVHPFACADSRSSRNLVRHPSLSRPRPCHTHWTPLHSPIRVPIPPVSPSASHCSYPRADAHAHAMLSLRLVAPVPFSHPPSPLCVTPSQFHSKVLASPCEEIHESLAATCACDAHSSSIAPWWRYASTG